MLADNAGFDLTLDESDRKRWNEASRIGFKDSNHAPMAALLKKRLKKRDDGNKPAKTARPRKRSKVPRPGRG